MTQKKESLKVAGYSIRTINQNGQAMQDIGALWAKVMDGRLNKIPHKIGNEIIAVYYDYEGDYTKPYSCLIGVPVSGTNQLPTGVTDVTVPTQKYEVFEAKGKMPEALIQTWQKIWSTPLKRNYRFDLEVYDEKSFAEASEVKVWIGVSA